MHDHAISLDRAGLRDEALEASAEAVNLYRELIGLNRNAQLPGLAASVHNHTMRLAEAGRRVEALETSGEAVNLRRELIGLNRNLHLPDLAGSLWSMGWVTVLFEAWEHAPRAIEAVTEAVHIYSELSATEPDAFVSLRDSAAKTLDELNEK
ncbi:hypothetical protein [Micromonospora sp. RTGN7]|uniref:hypothetical protein n=1 Tax=Micromonospora sp. RTGN7 TaxID=3016526 RepID=UPI0029FF4702|nr:hypothetical protein [Micromonospora sp. RTGN7]